MFPSFKLLSDSIDYQDLAGFQFRHILFILYADFALKAIINHLPV
jgi:hypothetical protein